MDHNVYISINLPLNFNIKLLEDATFDILYKPPSNSTTVELNSQVEQNSNCKFCHEEIGVKVYCNVSKEPQKAEDANLPQVVSIKAEDSEDDFDYSDPVEPKAEVTPNEKLLLSFSAENPEDIKELYENYGKLCKKGNENFFIIGNQVIYWVKHDEKLYFMSFDPAEQKCDICGCARKVFGSLLKHRGAHCFENFQKDSCKLCNFQSEDKKLLLMHALLCTKKPQEESIGDSFDTMYEIFKRKAKTYPYYETRDVSGTTFHFYQRKSSNTFYMANFDIRSCKCDVCALEFKTISNLLKHRHLHFCEVGEMECDVCKAKFSSEAAVLKHTLVCPKKGEIKPFDCKFCHKVFKNFHRTRLHETGHKRGDNWRYFHVPSMCHLCSKTCDDNYALTVHLRKAHEINPLRCEHCPKFFGDMKTLSVHLIGRHFPHLGQFKCSLCDKLFPNRGRLESHNKNLHDEAKHSCQHCGRAFSIISNLQTHIKSLHADLSERKKYNCETCGKLFFTKFTLQTHALRHKPQEEWPFHCTVCEKRFVTKGKLKEHSIVHAKSPQNRCTECGKDFHSKMYLADHMNLHTGAKPYECKVCQKRFSDRGNLRSHLKNHEKATGVKLVLSKEESRLVKHRVMNSESILTM